MNPYLMSLLAHERLSAAYARADSARLARELRRTRTVTPARRGRATVAPAALALRPGCVRPIGCSV